jgi:predicted amidohydrolase YtcJ
LLFSVQAYCKPVVVPKRAAPTIIAQQTKQTVKKAQSWVEAMVIEKGQLLFFGPESEAKNWVNENT